MQTRNQTEEKWTGAVVALAVVLIWELASRMHVVDPIFFPAFSSVLSMLGKMIITLETWENIGYTMLRCSSGYLIACAFGIPTGILMGWSQRLYYALEPLVEILRPLPSAAIIPIAILFLGIGDIMKVFVIAYACLWPVLINSLDGVRSIDPVLIETGRTFALTRTRFLLYIVIPAASPHFVTGMRVALAMALILAITVEMIAGNNGIGFSILDAERSFKFTEMYAGVLLIGALGYLVNFAFVRLADRHMRWYKGFTASLV